MIDGPRDALELRGARQPPDPPETQDGPETRGAPEPLDPVRLVKADLHLHLVGSAAPHTVASLTGGHPELGVPADAAELAAFFTFRDFAHFLDVYTTVSALVQDPEDVVTLVAGLAGDLRRQETAYAEVTVTPVTHQRAGISPGDLAAALDVGAARARADAGVELAWVYDISGGDGLEGADLTLDAALAHPPSGLVGFGIGGPEAGVRRAGFAPHFARARAAGLHSVPHAGESVGPEDVWVAIEELRAERIGHGIAAVRDPRLLERLAEERIVLEVCPSSNVATGVVDSLEAHPLPQLIAAGVEVVLGSDDPPMFGTTLPEEYRRVREHLGLGDGDLALLARRSIEASFASAELKRRLLGDGAGAGGDARRERRVAPSSDPSRDARVRARDARVRDARARRGDPGETRRQ